ncbi:MAG: hypothetical protein IJZ64_06190 [Ruminococcus sp.]|nr:hypothetical protein [Ruminococcus sp.]
MAENGKKLAFGISVYLIIKAALNIVLNFNFGNIMGLLSAGLIMVTFVKKIPIMRYVTAIYLYLLFIANIQNNIVNISSNWIYLIEGILDIIAGAMLIFQKDIKAYFEQ